jgi:hypothetical protein
VARIGVGHHAWQSALDARPRRSHHPTSSTAVRHAWRGDYHRPKRRWPDDPGRGRIRTIGRTLHRTRSFTDMSGAALKIASMPPGRYLTPQSAKTNTETGLVERIVSRSPPHNGATVG